MKKSVYLAAMLCTLTACGSLDATKVRQELGLIGQPPDEFMVTTRRPLDIPSGQALSLPKPTPGAASRVVIDPLQQASSALFGDQAMPQSPDFRVLSEAEADLLRQTEVHGQTTDNIRATLESEVGNSNRDTYLIYQLLPTLKAPGDRDETIDARAEAERLRQKGVEDVPTPPVEN